MMSCSRSINEEIPVGFGLTQQIQSSNVFLLLLPDELFTYLLTFLSPSDCGQLSLTSTLIKEKMMEWLGSSSCLKQCLVHRVEGELEEEGEFNQWLGDRRQFGTLCKRASMLLSIRERLELLITVYDRLGDMGCRSGVDSWRDVCKKAGLAAALHSLTLGWGESEMVEVVERLKERFPLLVEIGTSQEDILKPHRLWKERRLNNTFGCEARALLRTFFWDCAGGEGSYVWLRLMLSCLIPAGLPSSLIPYFKARLLMLMLGPVDFDHFDSFPEDTTDFQFYAYSKLNYPVLFTKMWNSGPESYEEARDLFTDLGKGLRLLDRDATKAEVPLIISAIFEDGDWMLDNMAICLMFSSQAVTEQYLEHIYNMEKGVNELAGLLTSVVAMCGSAMGNDLNHGTYILDYAFALPKDREQRRSLVEEFWNDFDELMEFDYFGADILVQLGVYLGMLWLGDD